MKIKSFGYQREIIYLLFIIIISFYSSFNQPGGYFCCYDTDNVKNIKELPIISQIDTSNDGEIVLISVHSTLFNSETFLNYSMKIPDNIGNIETFKTDITLKLSHVIRLFQNIVFCSLFFGFMVLTLKVSTLWSFIATTVLVLHPIFYPETIYKHINIVYLIGIGSLWVSLNSYLIFRDRESFNFLLLFQITSITALKCISSSFIAYPFLFIWDICSIMINRKESFKSFIIRLSLILTFSYIMISIDRRVTIYYNTVDLDRIQLINPSYSLIDRFEKDKMIFMNKYRSIQRKIESSQYNELNTDEVLILTFIPLVALSIIISFIELTLKLLKPVKKRKEKSR